MFYRAHYRSLSHSLLIHTPTSAGNESKNSGFIKILLPYAHTHTHTWARFPCTWLTLAFPYATPTKRHISPTANDPLPQFVVVGTRGSCHDITRTALLQAAWYLVVRGFPCSVHISHIKSSSITLNFVASNILHWSTTVPSYLVPFKWKWEIKFHFSSSMWHLNWQITCKKRTPVMKHKMKAITMPP